MLAPEVDEKKEPKPKVVDEKKKLPRRVEDKKEWHPFLVVDHTLRPQGYFNDNH